MRPQTDPQRMLADTARHFAERRAQPARIRACRQRVPDFDADVWAEMAQLGWFSVLVPEADGGLGSGLAELGQLVYEWGAHCGPEPLVASAVLAAGLLIDADGPARARLLAATMDGSALPALAWLDAGARCDAVAGGWFISGSARFVTPADAGEFLLVFAEPDQPAFWLSAATSGLRIQRESRIDGLGALHMAFDGVRVDPADLVATPARAAAAAESARDRALIMASVYMSGTMRRINEMTQEYLRTRVQFGKPIGSFQALQHKAVDMHIAEQLARDVAQNACLRVDAGCSADQRACLASRAKARAGESLDRIARTAVQLHGAIGYTDEYDLSLHLNRALAMSAWLGNAEHHVRRYARHAPAFEAAQA